MKYTLYVITQLIIVNELVSGFLIKKSDTFFFEDVKFGGEINNH